VAETRSVPREETALLDVTLRLARQVEQQLQELRRMRNGEQPLDLDGVARLEHVAHRMRRDGECLRLLCGADPGWSGAPRSVSSLLDDAVGAAEARARVRVRPAPVATIGPRAGAELLHVLAALLDPVVAEPTPGVGVAVGSRLGHAGLAVDVCLEGGVGRPTPTSWSAAGLAEALARRSACGIHVERPPVGSGAVVATVYCPAAVLTTPRPESQIPESQIPESRIPEPAPESTVPEVVIPDSIPGDRGYTSAMQSIARSGPLSSPADVDELFGPLPTSVEPADDPVGTPIFEAVASAWFQEERTAEAAERNGHPFDWESPGDEEWRAAAARAARPVSGTTTAAGLPRRRPGDQMVVPPRDTGRRRQDGADERVPDRVRERLATYQRGLQQGRHRAVEPADSGVWWTEPTA
jgi:hypothetical protein